MNILIVIPARSGSKGVPHKNIREVNGKPLMAHTIEYAKNSGVAADIVVSTDSVEYAGIARKYGIEVPFLRPKELALDHIRDFPVIEHALISSEAHFQKEYQYIVLLRPTSPLRIKGLINQSILALEDHKEADSIRAVSKVSEHAYRQWSRDGSFIKGLFNNVDESYNIPRQELPELYFQTGDIEVLRRSTVVKNKSVSGKLVLPLVLDDFLDIDNEKDFDRLENEQ